MNGIKANLPKMQAALPDDIRVRFEFDQSPYVTRAMTGVAGEAALGAALTGLMVLLFLRDWRSAIVVVLNIPLALIGALVALALTGQTINLMTLGGLALAVGILVDEATVEVENIHTQLGRSPTVAHAVCRGNAETAVPRLLAMLCVLAVFIPAFFLTGPPQALFVPLALAVGFAMITSYLLSSTLVPVLSVWLLRGESAIGGERGAAPASASTRASSYAAFVALITRWRWAVVPVYFVAALAVVLLIGTQLGRDIFPRVDAGLFGFRLRAPAGTRIEQTEEIVQEALAVIDGEAGAGKVAITLGYVGVVPPNYPINSVYLWTSGPEEAVMRVALQRDCDLRVDELQARLRDKLEPHLRAWLERKWLNEGVPAARAARAADLRLSFEPADIVNEVMSFGSPTPVEVVVSTPASGPKQALGRAFAAKVFEQLRGVTALCDLQYSQSLDYPTVEVHIDRKLAGRYGVTAEDVAKSLVAATSSSRFVVPNYWRDPTSGIGYQVQVEIPQAKMDSAKAIELTPVRRAGADPLLLRDVAGVREGVMPGQIDRYNMRRLVSMTANVQGSDLGRVATALAGALAAAGEPPPDIHVEVRGQVTPLQELTRGLGVGLALAVAVVFLLLTGYFQSIRLALVAVSAVPAVLAGVVLALLLTRTTLNLQSFMGAIMAVGVAVANAILLVTFAERARRRGRRWAGGCRRRARSAAADPDDQRGHDGRHAAHGAGLRRGRRTDGAARSSGHRRLAGGNVRHAVLSAGRVRAADGQGRVALAVAAPRRPGESLPHRPRPADGQRPSGRPCRGRLVATPGRGVDPCALLSPARRKLLPLPLVGEGARVALPTLDSELLPVGASVVWPVRSSCY